MPLGGALEDNDDYIISLLKRDADANKNQYSLLGGAGTARRRAKDAPKPNTKFLGNLVREVDSHNAALKAKEEAESRARLRNLRREERATKDGMEDGGERPRKKARTAEREGRWASAFGGLGGSGSGRRVERANDRHQDEDVELARRRENSPRRPKDSAHRDSREKRSRRDDRSRSPDHRKKRRRRSSSRDREGSRSPRSAKSRRTDRSPGPVQRTRPSHDDPASESDPLESFLGPAPPPKNLPRGRGALKTSAIDSRFAANYDPKADLDDPDDIEAEGDDWDLALEALRDRMKWRTQGAERLRAAGFTEEEVERAQASKGKGVGEEKGVEDVRWRKHGEAREWDRGKVESGEGIEVKAEWAR